MSYTVPERVGWVVDDEEDRLTVHLAILPVGPVSVLEGTAALIWLAATEGPAETLADRVADEAGVEVSGVRDEVWAFVHELVDAGLLAP